MAKFEGNFEGFRFTPVADTPTNSIVQVGALTGVTRQNFKAGETGLAFLTAPASVYSFPLASAAVATAAIGDLVTISSGVVSVAGAGDTGYGCLFAPIAVGDTEATVLLFAPGAAPVVPTT